MKDCNNSKQNCENISNSTIQTIALISYLLICLVSIFSNKGAVINIGASIGDLLWGANNQTFILFYFCSFVAVFVLSIKYIVISACSGNTVKLHHGNNRLLVKLINLLTMVALIAVIIWQKIVLPTYAIDSIVHSITMCLIVYVVTDGFVFLMVFLFQSGDKS